MLLKAGKVTVSQVPHSILKLISSASVPTSLPLIRGQVLKFSSARLLSIFPFYFVPNFWWSYVLYRWQFWYAIVLRPAWHFARCVHVYYISACLRKVNKSAFWYLQNPLVKVHIFIHYLCCMFTELVSIQVYMHLPLCKQPASVAYRKPLCSFIPMV